MAVIINDFEVELEAPGEPASEENTPEQPPPAPTLAPQDIHDVLHREVKRRSRLRVH